MRVTMGTGTGGTFGSGITTTASSTHRTFPAFCPLCTLLSLTRAQARHFCLIEMATLCTSADPLSAVSDSLPCLHPSSPRRCLRQPVRSHDHSHSVHFWSFIVSVVRTTAGVECVGPQAPHAPQVNRVSRGTRGTSNGQLGRPPHCASAVRAVIMKGPVPACRELMNSRTVRLAP